MKKIKYSLFLPILLACFFLFSCGGEVSSNNNSIVESMSSSNNKESVVIQGHVHKYKESIEYIDCKSEAIRVMQCECGESYTETFEPGLDHDFGDWEITIPPMEGKEGEEVRTCTRCNYEESRLVEPLVHQHNYIFTYVVEATCEHEGYTTHECICKDSYRDNYIPIQPHSYGEIELISMPSFDYEGEAIRYCVYNRAHYETITLPILNDTDYIVEEITKNTCEQDGYSMFTYIYDNSEIVFEAVTPAKEHKYSEWQLTTTPTNDSEGLLTKYCINDDSHYETIDLPKLSEYWRYNYNLVTKPDCQTKGLYKLTYYVDEQKFEFDYETNVEPSRHNFTTETFAPTCTDNGYTHYSCKCGYSYDYDFTSPLKHDYSEWEIVNMPTNTTQGKVISYCKNDSSHQATHILPNLSSSLYSKNTITKESCEVDGVYEYTYNGYENEIQQYVSVSFQITIKGTHRVNHILPQNNTCTEDGWLEHYYCHTCEQYATDEAFKNIVPFDDIYLYRKGHSYGNWQILQSPSLSNGGSLVRYCIHDNNHKETKSIPNLNENDYIYEVLLEPSCKANGSASYTYTIDETSFSFEVELEKNNHIFNNDYTFYNKNGHYSYCKNCDYKALETHSFVDGFCDKCAIHESIMLLSFYENSVTDCESSATEVYIPSYYQDKEINKIEGSAFGDLPSLYKIVIPNTIKAINWYAFDDSDSLKAVYYASTIEDWLDINIDSSANFALTSLYCYDQSDKYYLVEEVSISNKTQENNVKFINSLKSIYLTYDLAALSGTLQLSLPDLEKIYYTGNSSAWFRNDFSSLSSIKDVSVLDTPIYIQNQYGEYFLPKVIEVDSQVENLKYHLYPLAQLEEIIINTNLQEIDSVAFNNTPSLTKVYYKGDASLWNNIKFISVNSNPMQIANEFYTLANGEWKLLTEIRLNSSVDVVNSYAFNSFECAKSIVIEGSETLIEKGAFTGCNQVTSLTIPFIGSDINAKKSSYLGHLFDMDRYALPDSLTELIYTGNTIKYSALSYSDYDGVTTITTIKFTNKDISGRLNIPSCLKNVYFEGTLNEWLSNDFYIYAPGKDVHFYLSSSELINVIIPDGTTTIKTSKFAYFSNIESVIIPDSVTSIDNAAFYRCSLLETVKMSENIQSIGDFAFCDCSSLTSINIPNTLKNFGSNGNAFEGCNLLTYYQYENCNYLGNSQNNYIILVSVIDKEVSSLQIHNDTKFIAKGALSGCSRLLEIIIPESVISIGTNAFYNCKSIIDLTMYGSTQIIHCTAFERATIQNFYYVGSLEDYLTIDYVGTDSFTNLSFETPVSYNTAFYISDDNGDFKVLNNVVIPESITELKNIQFFCYDYLLTITLHNDITYIGDLALYACDRLTAVYYNGTIDEFLQVEIYDCITNAISDPSMIYVLDSNGAYASINDIKSYSFNEGVSEAKDFYFTNLETITDLYIPSSLESLNNISYTSTLTNVYYNGTIEDWMNIYFDEFKSNPMFYANNFYMLDENDNWYKVTSITLPNNYHLNPNSFIGFNKTLDTVYIPYIGIINENTDIKLESIFGNSEYKISKIVIQNNVEINDLTFKNFKFDSLIFEKDVYMHNSNAGYYNSATDIYIYGKYEGYSSFSLNNLYIGNIEAWLSGDVHTSISVFDKNIYVLDGNNNWVVPTHIIIPNTINELISMPFRYFKELTSITIPSTITHIESLVFYGCDSLENVYYEGSLEEWCNINFETSQANPMYYAKHFFIKDQNGEYYEVTNIELDGNIASIGNYQFYGFDNVTSIVIPNSVVVFGQDVFEGCNSLESLTIPFAGEAINSDEGSLGYLFGGSSSYIPSSLKEITFTKKVHNRVALKNEYIEKVIISEGIDSIGILAFSECINLKEVVLSNTVTSIENYAFSSCSNLVSINIPSSVTSIGKSAFLWCNQLNKITLPFVGQNADGSEATYLGHIFGALSAQQNSMYVPASLNEVVIDGNCDVNTVSFEGCNYITKLTLSANIKSFNGSSLPSNISIYYKGSQEQWNALIGDNEISNPVYFI